MTPLWRRCRALAVVLVGIVAASLVAGGSASAQTCAAPVRYASSSDTIYLSPGTVATLSAIKAACPSAPLVQSAPGVWELNADLVVQGGAKLDLAAPDVKTLRLQSLPSGLAKDVTAITAQYGTINLTGVTVTSWNGSGPDTDLTVPSGGTRGRAYIRARSVMEGSTPRASTMNITDSDLGFLGFNGGESYGVAYKAVGCGVDTPDICAKLDVFGTQSGSKFHDNYMGTYTWGAKDMKFTGNTYTHNKYYGLDPHDDSDYLTITGNTFSENGNHGLICSQRCDHLTITGNTSTHNTSTTAETHGIMLHRGVTDSVIADNIVTDNTTGAGIAIFDSVGNTIRNNTVTNNKYGLRFSVGTRDTVVTGNKVTKSLLYAVYTYKGTDAPSYTGTSGRPTGITFTDNTFAGGGTNLFKIQDADKFTFTGGAITPDTLAKGPRFERAGGHAFGPVTTPKGTVFTLRGSSAVKTTLAINGIPAVDVKIDKDAYSSATFNGTPVTTASTGTSTTPALVDSPVTAVKTPGPAVAEAPPAVGEASP